jgi:hypothetical protein
MGFFPMIPGRYPMGIIKKEEEGGKKKKTNQTKAKTFQNMKTPTYISMHSYAFL